MTDSPTSPPSSRKRSGGLSTMLIADLKSMAQGMGVAGAGSMKKAQLIEAIKAASSQGGPAQGGQSQQAQQQQQGQAKQQESQAKQQEGKQQQAKQQESQAKQQQAKQQEQTKQQQKSAQSQQQDKQKGQQQTPKQQTPKQQQDKQQQDKQADKQAPRADQQGDDADDEQGSRRNRRRRGRDRRTGRGEPDTTVLDDDVLVPAAGILDVLDNYAFVRTSGYLAGPDDVYLSLSMVRKHGLRRGDAVAGQVRQPREGERREKFNPMVRVDSVNGVDPDGATDRPDFAELTPVHPTDRLRLETGADDLLGRVIDLVAPIGKGQRGLVLSPPRSGRTQALRSVARSIATNHPECHLMVVLVDERPEEVTDYQREVRGEVIASSFDRPASDHTAVAELAVERARRLVELGHDVVVLLDSITALARAHATVTPASGRVLAGGVDAAAIQPARRFFGAARNVEDGGSLTILATAMVETGSATDEVILEELEGTATMELRMRRDFAEDRLHPPVDPLHSGTRREDILLGEQEQAVVWSLRKLLAGAGDERSALELLLQRMSLASSNIELLTRVQKSS